MVSQAHFYGPGSALFIDNDRNYPGELTASVGVDVERLDQVASSSESDPTFFRWLVTAAAAHSSLPLVDRTSDRPTVTCPRCRATSAHPEDVRSGYCGACHTFFPPIR